ncbi:MAG: hypothetical protein DRP42_07440 [Tenericutes bacterium]|nr:MAG: hypothetical protein DRP42_07440 [Mycoplasmatota bacterium]
MIVSFKKATLSIIPKLKAIGVQAKAISLSILNMGRAALRAAARIKSSMGSAFRFLRAGFRKIINASKLAAIAIIGVGVASVKLASDAIETENLFSITFDKMTASARRWAEGYSKALGLFIPETKKAFGTFQLMLTSMGVGEKKAFGMSKQLTSLVNDIASFRNVKPGEVFTKIAAGITGETEGLKRIGILISDTIIKQMALSDASFMAGRGVKKTGIEYKKYGNIVLEVNKSTKKAGLELTSLEKVMLRFKAILNITNRDQGDMARTLNDAANVFRVLWAQIKTTGVTIGNVLLPAVTKVAIVMRDWLKENQETVAKWAVVVRDGVLVVGKEILTLFNLAKNGDFEGLGKRLSDTLSKVAESVRKILVKFTPIAFDIGKAIGDGFWSSFRDTAVGKAIRSFSAPRQLETIANLSLDVDVRRIRTERSIGSITERATGRRVIDDRASTENQAIIEQLKKLNAIVGREVAGAF